jgi:hypothetical protein
MFEYRPQPWDRFVSGELWWQWAKEYPQIFDGQYIQIAKNQAGPKMRYHFHEWLAAVLIFHTYGYLSLIEQYEFKAAPERKPEVIKTNSAVRGFYIGYGPQADFSRSPIPRPPHLLTRLF